VKVNVLDALVKEERVETRGDVRTVAYLGGDHHVRCIVGPGRDEATTYVVGNLADRENALRRAPAHVDRPRCLIGRRDKMVLIIEQQKLIAWRRVDKADPAGITGVFGRDDALGAHCSEPVIRQIEQRLKRLRGKAGETE
jgi:hypothetical protein